MPSSLLSRGLAALLAVFLAVPAAAAERSIPSLTPPALPLDGSAASAPRLESAALPGQAALPESALSAAIPAAAETSSAGEPPRADASGDDEGSGAASRNASLDAAFDGSRPAAGSVEEPLEDVQALFEQAHPGLAVADTVREATRGGSTFAQYADMFVHNDLFSHTPGSRQTGEHMVPHGYPGRQRHIALIDAVLDFADRAASEPLAARFVASLARMHARELYPKAVLRGDDYAEVLPPNPLGSGEYWDMAAGPNGARLMMGSRDSRTHYRFFDQSPYVVEYLKEMKRLMAADGRPASNVEITRADIRRLARPPTPLSVLRSKNAHTYVAGFEKQLEAMSDWIAPGGALVLQNDPGPGQTRANVRVLGPMIERLLAKGWTLDFGGFSEDGHLETLTLIRPRSASARPDPASRAVWERYVQDVRSMPHMMDLGSLLQMLGMGMPR